MSGLFSSFMFILSALLSIHKIDLFIACLIYMITASRCKPFLFRILNIKSDAILFYYVWVRGEHFLFYCITVC